MLKLNISKYARSFNFTYLFLEEKMQKEKLLFFLKK